jgi:uncharacterized protein (TIGR02466 family)
MEPQFNSLFNVPVLFKETKINTKPLIKYINKISKNSKVVNSNIGGIHSPYFDIKDPVLNDLKKEIIKNMDNYFNNLMFENTKLKFKNMWSITNKSRDYNLTHNHPFSMFSGVFYVKVPKNCGRIIFEHPAMSSMHFWYGLKRKEFNNYNSATWAFDIKEKDLLIFPSWLYHRVEPNLSNKERIVISFNIGA